MMCKVIIALLLLVNSVFLFSQEEYMFRVNLRNKGETTYSLNRPEQYLSKKSIERRKRQKIAIDITDLPISDKYIAEIERVGCKVVAKSKWLSTVCIYCQDSSLVAKVRSLDFVEKTELVWYKNTYASTRKTRSESKKNQSLERSQTEYGYSWDQFKTINGNYLHDKGYRGKGMEIAVIDAGYNNFYNLPLLDNISVMGYKNFVYNGEDIFGSSDHGLKVLSVLGTNRPGSYMGTAPEAKYWLFKSEDSLSEYPIEEDYWVSAAEYADSIGVDIINTSLGYTTFDWPARSYTIDQLDGKTAQITKGATMATQKGIFVEVSAGNEGHLSWRKIAFPADAVGVLTVGAVAKDSIVATFSSRGPTVDGRIKPDVVVLGSKIHVVTSTGDIEQANGTSYAGPVMSGMAACLWQAHPNLTNFQLLDVIRRSANKFASPTTSMGYGIPDMRKAMHLAREITSGINDEFDDTSNFFQIYPIDTVGNFSIKVDRPEGIYTVIVSTIDGKIVLNEKVTEPESTHSIPGALRQVYVVNIKGNNLNYSQKIKF